MVVVATRVVVVARVGVVAATVVIVVARVLVFVLVFTSGRQTGGQAVDSQVVSR